MTFMIEEEQTYRLSQSLGTALSLRADELDQYRMDPHKYKPIPTHIGDLNKIIGGFPIVRPFIMTIFAKEKIGKTTIAMDMADAWRKGGEKVLYVQLEELAGQYADRHIAAHTSLTKDDIRDLNISDEQMQEIRDHIKQMQDSGQDNLYLQDDLFVLEAIMEEAKRMKIKRIVLDNMSLFDLAGVKGSGEREKLVNLVNMLVRYRNKEGFSFVIIAHEGGDNKAYGSSHLNKASDILIQIEFVFEGNGGDDKKDPVKVPGQRLLRVHESRLCGAGVAYVTFDGAKNKIGPITKVALDSEFEQLLKSEKPIQVVGLPLLGQGL